MYAERSSALPLRDHMLGDQFSTEAGDRVGVGDNRLGVVLCLEEPSRDDLTLSRDRPVCRSLARNLAVGDETLGVAYLMRGGLADGDVGIELRKVLRSVGV